MSITRYFIQFSFTFVIAIRLLLLFSFEIYIVFFFFNYYYYQEEALQGDHYRAYTAIGAVKVYCCKNNESCQKKQLDVTINTPMRKQHDVITYWKCRVRGHAKLKVKEIISQLLIKSKVLCYRRERGTLVIKSRPQH